MHEVPRPTHGFFSVIVTFFAYVVLVVGVGVGLSALSLPEWAVLVGSVVAAAGLFAVFLPLFRRFTPAQAGDE